MRFVGGPAYVPALRCAPCRASFGPVAALARCAWPTRPPLVSRDAVLRCQNCMPVIAIDLCRDGVTRHAILRDVVAEDFGIYETEATHECGGRLVLRAARTPDRVQAELTKGCARPMRTCPHPEPAALVSRGQGRSPGRARQLVRRRGLLAFGPAIWEYSKSWRSHVCRSCRGIHCRPKDMRFRRRPS